jgi:DNA-binding MarR family transcriptional regulator
MMKQKSQKKKPTGGVRPAARLKVLPALTQKQGRCLLFIFNYYAENKHFPTHREIAEEMGIRSTTAAMYLEPLVEKGYLTRVTDSKKEARNIRITSDGVKRLRLLGASI